MKYQNCNGLLRWLWTAKFIEFIREQEMFEPIAKLEPKKSAEKLIFNVENSLPHYFQYYGHE